MAETASSTRKGEKKLGPYKNAIPNLNEHQIISKHNENVETDLLNMITNIAKENEGAIITIPANTPVVPPLNSVVIQQGQIHTQTQVQEYERKSTMSRRVINETTLRIYVPRNPDEDSTLRINPTTPPGHFNSATLLSQDETTAMLGPPCLFTAHSPSIHMMSTRVYLVKI